MSLIFFFVAFSEAEPEEETEVYFRLPGQRTPRPIPPGTFDDTIPLDQEEQQPQQEEQQQQEEEDSASQEDV